MERAPKNTVHLVAVSGGADSMALLHLLVEAGFRKLVVCHLNHGLRGRESAGDARFVAAMARRLKLQCEIGKTDVPRLMRQGGGSMETVARDARHRFFAVCGSKHRCRRVLLAHHADDQAETLLWNLLRGSRGWRGMEEEQTIRIDGSSLQLIRPLLGCRHGDLVGWLTSRNHKWREDSTNGQPVAIRNRLRNEVIPLLGEISNRDPVAGLLRALEDWKDFVLLETEILEMAQLEDPEKRIHLPSFRKLPTLLRHSVLKKYLEAHGVRLIDRDLIERCDSLGISNAEPSVNLPGGGRLRRTAARLWVER